MSRPFIYKCDGCNRVRRNQPGCYVCPWCNTDLNRLKQLQRRINKRHPSLKKVPFHEVMERLWKWYLEKEGLPPDVPDPPIPEYTEEDRQLMDELHKQGVL